MRWIEWFVPGVLVVPLHQLATVLAIVLLAAIVARAVFAAGKITLDRVMGAINLYLLLGIAFAIAYQTIAMHVPGAFGGTAAQELGFATWAYFSFTTLTTVGYGDITPVAPLARSMASFEAFVGQLYPAIILARLVSLQIAGAKSSSS
jgi:voltage-gated potassium channel Kch